MKTMNATPERKAMIELLESMVCRLECRAREMDNARAFGDRERMQACCMVVIYMDISNMLRLECKRLSKDNKH